MNDHASESSIGREGDGIRDEFQRRIRANDSLIRSRQLDIGRQIAADRAAIFTDVVHAWALEQHTESGYDRPFAVVALGGTGRAELTPYSDLDIAFLFDDQIEENSFLLGLQRQVLHTDDFESRFGFSFGPLPFCLDDVIDLHGKQLNSFLDMAPVYDPHGLTARFRTRIKATFDPFELFLHVRDFWSRKWEEAAEGSEDIDHFDIKNEGLRIFLAAIWTLAGKDFSHSHTIYDALPDSRDLEAYDFLLRIRAFVHSRRGDTGRPNLVGDHPQDLLEFDDFLSFGEMLGSETDEQARFEFATSVRAQLLASRRRISRFAKGVIGHELSKGVSISQESSIAFGQGGLFQSHASTHPSQKERSRNALQLLVASQYYDVPIDDSELQNTFQNAGDWMTRVSELSSLFYDTEGSLAKSLDFLCQIDGVGENLFPGYALFEASIDERVMTEKQSLRGKVSRRKLAKLESLLEDAKSAPGQSNSPEASAGPLQEVDPTSEAALLDPDSIAAIRLALVTKRLPLTDDDLRVRSDETAGLYDRFSSGFSQLPVADYYQPFIDEAGFSEHTIELVKFLVTNRRAFKLHSEPGIIDESHVSAFADLAVDLSHLRTLFVFTCIDRAEWESESSFPTRWFNIKELYSKVHSSFRPSSDPASALKAQGYDAQDLAVLRDFGTAFYGGRYRRFANRFGPHLIRLAQDQTFNPPKVSMLQDGRSHILGVSARDNPGLAASICGVLWKNQIEFGQAHLFSASTQRLALDFFHLNTPPDKLPPGLTQTVEESILRASELAATIDDLPDLDGETQIQEWREGHYRLRYEGGRSPAGAIYALTSHLYLKLQADVFGLTAHYRKSRAHIAIFFKAPATHSKEELEEMAAKGFA